MTVRFLSIQDAADQLGHVSASTLYRLHREGKFPARKIGRRLVISEARLEAWADERMADST